MLDHLNWLDKTKKKKEDSVRTNASRSNTDRTIEAFRMIDTTHRFEILIAGFDRKFAASAFGLKHTSKICKWDARGEWRRKGRKFTFGTVGLTFFDMKWIWTERFLACKTDKTLRMPCFFHCMNTLLRWKDEVNEERIKMKLVSVLSRSFENILHKTVRDIVRNLVHNIICHSLPRNHNPEDWSNNSNR